MIARDWVRVCSLILLAPIGCGGDGDGPTDGGMNPVTEKVCLGDRWAESTDTKAALAACTTVTGNLSITSNVLTSIELPVLTRVDGFLTVWGSRALVRASFPKLTTVGGYMDVSANPALVSLDLPVLTSINHRDIEAAYDLIIRDNKLSTCQTDSIRQRLLASGFRGTADISGDNGPCAP